MNSKRFVVFPLLILMLGALLGACGMFGQGPEVLPTETPAPATEVPNEATIEDVQVQILESFPVQVHAVIRGTLPDACSFVESVTQERESTSFRITLNVARRANQRCAPQPTPFEQTIPLDVQGLPAGTYTVLVGDKSATFELAVANEPPAETGSIGGIVWHDECAIAGGEGGEPATPSGGCVSAEGGGYRANGILEDDEMGIAGVQVSLGEGACPSTEVAVATTDEAGRFTFPELSPGTYCVTIDPAAGPNESILLPGEWTAPDLEQGSSVTVELPAGADVSDVNFGWDHQFLPEPAPQPTVTATSTPTSTTCTNQAAFVSDVTIPDNMQVAPGAQFTKTWRIRNTGTCTWGTDYALVYYGGAQLGAPDRVPLNTTVQPGATVDISVDMTAPVTPGNYGSNWQFEATDGERFGVGAGGSTPIFAKIVVPSGSTPTPGTMPTERINFPAGSTIYSFTPTLTEGQPRGYILNVQAGQTMMVTASGDIDISLLDPSGNVRQPAEVPMGTHIYPIPATGDYTLVLEGAGQPNVTIEIPSNEPPVPATTERITFAPGETSTTVTTTLVEGQPRGYVMGVQAQQRVIVSVADGTLPILTMLDPNGDVLEPLAAEGNYAEYTVPTTGDYTLVVQGIGSTTLEISIPAS